MNKFIKVTSDGKPLWINVNSIKFFSKTILTDGSNILLADCPSIYVKETPEEILALINGAQE